jgi:hypothetical protein
MELRPASGDEIELRVGFRVRLFRAADGATLDEYRSEAVTPPQPIAWWQQGSAVSLRASLIALQTGVAEQVLEEFVIGYPEGHLAVDPPAPRLLQPQNTSLLTNRPALAWEPWPWSADTASFAASAVVYDLRVYELATQWQGDHAPSGEIAPVYERFGLAEPAHALESDLERCSEYDVRVRARVPIDGIARATEWVALRSPEGGTGSRSLDTLELEEAPCTRPWYKPF